MCVATGRVSVCYTQQGASSGDIWALLEEKERCMSLCQRDERDETVVLSPLLEYATCLKEIIL